MCMQRLEEGACCPGAGAQGVVNCPIWVYWELSSLLKEQQALLTTEPPVSPAPSVTNPDKSYEFKSIVP